VGLGPAAAQATLDPNAPIPPADIPNVTPPDGGALRSLGVPDAIDPATGLPRTDPLLPGAAAPYAPSNTAPDFGLDIAPAVQPQLVLSAKLTDDGPPLEAGLVWRVFGAEPGPDGTLPLVAQANGGTASLKVEPGVYFVHCGFGFAGRTDRVEVGPGLAEQSVVLNAGGLKLQASASEDRPLPDDDVRFDIFAQETDELGERKAVVRDVAPGTLVRLGAGSYYVVSRYGTVNAQTHADVEVKPGKLSEVMLYQNAAEVTLKLVGEPGGEAIADTRWSILTPGGDIVTEGVGAFPSFILAAGGYTVVARHDDAVFQREFDVESGRDAEVEVIAEGELARP
jgi:hypothetical protein